MNITRSNFTNLLPFLKTTITRSHFISLDLEMSGINTEDLTSPSILDAVLFSLTDARQVPETAAIYT